MIENFIKKRYEGLWFQYLQKSNTIFVIVEGQDDITYYMSLLQAYNIKEDNYVIKSPTQISSQYENGVSGILKIVENYLLPYTSRIEKNFNKLLIITDKDVGQYSEPDILSEEVRNIYYQTQGYSFENDFVTDELLEYLCNNFIKEFNRRHHIRLSNGELTNEKDRLWRLYKIVQSEIKYVVDTLNENRKRNTDYKLQKISKYHYEDRRINYDSQSAIQYQEEITKESFHGKSMINVLLAILRNELKEIDIHKPLKNTDTLIHYTNGYIPTYWKEVFEKNKLYEYK